MAELPKSVIERLKQQAGAQEHPDTNLLAAFSERALTGREREDLLEHLAACARCREVVALARPDEAQQPATVLVPWHRRPQIFAWSAAVATLVVGAALVVNYRHVAAPPDRFQQRAATSAPAASPAAPTAESKPKIATDKTRNAMTNGRLAAPAEPAAARAMQRSTSRQDLAVAPQKVPADTKTLYGKKQVDAGLYDKLATKDDRAKSEMAAGERDQAAKLKAAQVAAPQPAPAAPAASNMAAVAKEQPSPMASSVEVQSSASGVAGAPGQVGGAMYSTAPLRKAQAARTAALTRWTISKDGRVQRSSDSGRSWQAVTIAKGATFRSVATVRQDVWAGGPGAALFHSADGGQSWVRQTLPGSGATIVALEFSDAQHGTARTDDGATWSTDDGGQHWAKP